MCDAIDIATEKLPCQATTRFNSLHSSETAIQMNMLVLIFFVLSNENSMSWRER